MYNRHFVICLCLCFFISLYSGANIIYASDDTTPHITFTFNKLYSMLNKEQLISIHINNAENLYGIEFILKFDPSQLTLLDANSQTEKIDLMPGDMLDINNSIILRNEVDNIKGVVLFTMSLTNPAPAVSGNGLIAELKFKPKVNDDNSEIVFQKAMIGIIGGRTIDIESHNLYIYTNYEIELSYIVSLFRVLTVFTFSKDETSCDINWDKKIGIEELIFSMSKVSGIDK